MSLPTITTSGDISPWKDVLEGIGFTVNTSAGTALWKDSGAGIRINGNGLQAYNGSNVATLFSGIVNTSVNFRYIKFNEKDIAFSIGTITWNDFIDTIICYDGTGWLIVAMDYISSASGTNQIQPSLYSRQLGYINGEIILVPFLYKTLKPQNLYMGLYAPDTSTRKSYICSVGDKKYYYNKTSSTNYYPGFAIDIDAIWDDSDY